MLLCSVELTNVTSEGEVGVVLTAHPADGALKALQRLQSNGQAVQRESGGGGRGRKRRKMGRGGGRGQGQGQLVKHAMYERAYTQARCQKLVKIHQV